MLFTVLQLTFGNTGRWEMGDGRWERQTKVGRNTYLFGQTYTKMVAWKYLDYRVKGSCLSFQRVNRNNILVLENKILQQFIKVVNCCTLFYLFI